MLTLNNFERQLDSTIVSRGRTYYDDRNVTELSHPSESVWRATVYGTDEYDVIIQLQDEKIISSHCSCPYDLGEYCKHEIAVMYALREAIKQEKAYGTNISSSPKKIPTEYY